MIVSDNGTELTSNAVLAWCGEIGVEWHYIAPRQSGSYRFVGRISIDKRASGEQSIAGEKQTSRYLSHVPIWITSGLPTIHELVLALTDAEQFDHSH